jgi:Zn-dependent protease
VTPITTARWTVSGSFLGLAAIWLGTAKVMQLAPDYGRFLVFPFVLSGWLISLCLHEFGHAIAGYYGGDRSVEARGYLTLDVLRYTHPQYSILWPMIFLAFGGIGLPGGAVYINMHFIRNAWSRTLVSAAGPLATLAVMLFLLALIPSVASPAQPALYASLTFLAFLQLSCLVLNLLPVPGLDGWGIIEPWLPDDIQEIGAQFSIIAPTLLFVTFMMVPPVSELFWRNVYQLAQLLDLDLRGVGLGYRMFQFWR